MHRYISPLSIR